VEGIAEAFIHAGDTYGHYTQNQLVEAYQKSHESLSTEFDPVIKKRYDEQIVRVDQLTSEQNSNTQNISVLIKQLDLAQKQIEEMKMKMQKMEHNFDIILDKIREGEYKLHKFEPIVKDEEILDALKSVAKNAVKNKIN
jgi:hypothetical protein